MSIPAFTSLSEVVSHLNATCPDTNNNYTVYGLTISAASAQSCVDHANKYVFSIVPSLTGPGSSDPREVSAELAALDIACIGILVNIVGGALVGAYDYSLGDMHVSRAGPFASAIKTAINAYRQSAKNNLLNVSTVAMSVNSSRYIPRYSGPKLFP